MNKRLVDVVKNALHEDNTIAVSKAELEQATGKTEAQMAAVGLSRNDLKKLERKGLELRGYAPTKKGHQLRWILVSNETKS